MSAGADNVSCPTFAAESILLSIVNKVNLVLEHSQSQARHLYICSYMRIHENSS